MSCPAQPLYWVAQNRMAREFPDPGQALVNPNGLLAVGGDLTPIRLLDAYRRGIFPWFSEGQPIMWWSPEPRSVLYIDALKISRSLRKRVAQQTYAVTIDQAFAQVIERCAQPRKDDTGTWINNAMIAAYSRLHRRGVAHSVECWRGEVLVGGLYGLAIGRIFYGESMFAHASDASKVALVHLVRRLQAWGYVLIDCQVHNRHLASLGAALIPRPQFNRLLDEYCPLSPLPAAWATQA